MSINNLNTYLNVRDAHLRVVSGNVYAQAMNIGGINVETAHGLQSVSDTGNVTSNTLQFSNATTGFITTANAQIGRDLVVTGNATVSTDLTVSANATVTDTLTVSEHLIASKEATVTGNLHVTTIRSDSNVVAEYTGPHDRPLRKYPEVALTADAATSSGYKGYKVEKSSDQSQYNLDAWRIFDGVKSAGNGWASQDGTYYDGSSPTNSYTGTTHQLGTGTAYGEWLKLELPNKIKVSKFTLYADPGVTGTNTWGINEAPKSYKIYGSVTGSSWTELKDVSNETPSTSGNSHNITDNTAYRYLGIVVTQVNTDQDNIRIGELEFYGHEEGSGSLDTTLKTVYNVPATTGTQLELYYDGRETSSYSGSGTTVNDLAGTQQNGTFNGGFDSTYKAFTFNGTSQNMTTTLANSGTPSAYVHTFAFWTKPISNLTNATQQAFLQLGTHSANSCSALRIEESTGLFRWFFHSNDIWFSASHIIFGEWNHIVAAYDGGSEITSRRIWVNGHEIHHLGSQTPGALSLSANAPLSIGSQNGGNTYFNGSIANFRLYSKALNADQVKELYDYQKDYFLGSKSQLTLYKGHLGVGVTEPSGQFELAGDERLQEYPPRALTDFDTHIEGHGVFKVYVSSWLNNGSFKAWAAFDKIIDGVGWHDTGSPYTNGSYAGSSSLGGVKGEWIVLKLPYAINLKSAATAPRNNYTMRAPGAGFILGSNDETNWDQLHSFSGLTATTGEYTYINNITAPGYYTTFALLVTELAGAPSSTNTNSLNISEIKFFGTPGPTTLDKGSLTLGRSLDVPRVSRYDVDTETPRPEKLVVDFDTTVNSSPTDISGKGNHGTFYNGAEYSAADKAFKFVGVDNNGQAANSSDTVRGTHGLSGTRPVHSHSVWFKQTTDHTDYTWVCAAGTASNQEQSGILLSGNSTYPNRITFDNYAGWVTSTVTAELNRWYHVVATFNGGTTFNTTNCRIYVDGVDCTGPESEVYNGTATFNLQGAILALGSTHNGTRGLTGLVSNYKLYDVVLEPSEVRKLYRLGRTGRSMVISDTAVGIGKAPEAQLDVRGNLNVDGVITNQQRPAFYVWRDGTGNNVEAIGHGGGGRLRVTGAITNWDSKRVDTAGTFDLNNGRYNIPASGLYMFIGSGVYRYQGSGNAILEATFFVNGSNANVRGISYNRGNTTSEHHTVTITFMRFMNAGDYVEMGLHECQSNCDLYYGDGLGYFSGYLLG